jgi:tripartite motif-containing protein 37
MLNQRSPNAQVVREFSSEFEVGECWGYNRFYRIDLLEREGYLNLDEDSITLKFFVRAPCYS